MGKHNFTRREAIKAAAVALAGVGLSGCGRGKTDMPDKVNDGPVSFVWKEIASGDEGPGARSRHGLVYDQAAKATVLFSGIIWDQDRLESDTWGLRAGHWFLSEPGKSPPARHRGGMAYDQRRGFAVLFGGQGQSGNSFPILGDTWLYEQGHWRPAGISSARQPSRRFGLCLAYDESAGVSVLFGGADGIDHSLADTWLFDGSSWQPVSGSAPPARRYAAFAYDPDLQGCVLNGGSDDESGDRGYGDTWLFRDRTWSRLSAGFDTDKRDDHGMAYHRTAKRLIMLEGVAGARGVLARGASGWRPVEAAPLHPRHQCSPLSWDEELDGLVLHGGEARHGGPQFDKTWVLRLAETS